MRTKFNTKAVGDEAKEQTRRKRAITGEHTEDAERRFLAVVIREVGDKLHLDVGRPSRAFVDCEEAIEDIIREVTEWLALDLADRWRLLDLSPSVRRWLRERIAGWAQHYAAAREALPSTVIRAAYLERLADYIWEQVDNTRYFADEYWHDYLENWKRPSTADILGIFLEGKEPYNQEVREFNKFVRKARDAVLREHATVKSWLEREFSFGRARSFPPKWITSDKRIRENLKRKCNLMLMPLFELICDGSNRMRRPYAAHQYVSIKLDYALIKERLRLDPVQARRYLQEMCHWQMAKQIGPDGEHGQMVYAMGDWVWAEGAPYPRPVWWLKNTPAMKNALRNFDANRRLRDSGGRK